MSKQITVIARLKAKPGAEKRLEDLLKSLVEPTRREPGCINYDLHRDLEETGVFYFYENWRSDKDLERHFQTPHLASLQEIAPEVLAEPVELRKLEMLGEKA